MAVSKELGREGERYAAKLLRKRGYKILSTNYTCKLGEIDIIALHKKERCICFVEVKARSSADHGGSLYAIGRAKMRQLARVAAFYIAERKPEKFDYRFDAVLLDSEGEGGITGGEVLQNIFSLEEIER